MVPRKHEVSADRYTPVGHEQERVPRRVSPTRMPQLYIDVAEVQGQSGVVGDCGQGWDHVSEERGEVDVGPAGLEQGGVLVGHEVPTRTRRHDWSALLGGHR